MANPYQKTNPRHRSGGDWKLDRIQELERELLVYKPQTNLGSSFAGADRHRIESQLLGFILLEGKYGQVAGIVEARHFSQWGDKDHAAIFQAIEDLQPGLNGPFAVGRYLATTLGDQYWHFVMRLIAGVYWSASPMYMACMLVEYAMRDNARALLWKVGTEGEANETVKAAISDVVETIEDMKMDVYTVITEAATYLSELGLPEWAVIELESIGGEIDRAAEAFQKADQFKIDLRRIAQSIDPDHYTDSVIKRLLNLLYKVKKGQNISIDVSPALSMLEASLGPNTGADIGLP
jgi:hypothetical protein